MDIINFEEFEPYIIGNYTVSDHFDIIMPIDNTPYKKDQILINGEIYIVDYILDVTTDEEREEGLLYSSVTFSKKNGNK